MIVVSTLVSEDGVIGLNGKQYLLDTDNEVMLFKDQETAKAFIAEHGEDPDSEYIEYEDYVEHELNEYSDNLKKIGEKEQDKMYGVWDRIEEDDEYAYPTTAEINEMRTEYLKEKDIQYVDNERETFLAQADYLKKIARGE